MSTIRSMRIRMAVALVSIMLMAMALFGGIASAALTTTCQNPAGNTPQGNCQGQALEQETVNPAGHAPPGHNR